MNSIDNIMALHDEACEAHHCNGSHLYNQTTAAKRQTLRAAIEQARAARVPDEPICPACKGSGEGGSYRVPFTADDFVEGPCNECDGTGLVAASQHHIECPKCTAPKPAQQAEWIDDAGRLQWALWRIKDLEDKLREKNEVKK